MTPQGAMQVLVEFSGNGPINKGARPEGGLTVGPDGTLYGMTFAGGQHDHGTIFKVTLAGELTTLVEFTDNGATNKGCRPKGRLTLGIDGNFYGMTDGGEWGYGTIFQMTPGGVLTTLQNLSNSLGSFPVQGTFIPDDQGHLYALTQSGGQYGYGTLVRIPLTAPEPVDQPLMEVTGNWESITHGQTQTSTEDFTDFGSVRVGSASPVFRLFRIHNMGEGDLTFDENAVSVTGADFAVEDQPISVAAPSGTIAFRIKFAPTSPGLKTATVTIASNDPVNPSFTFTIQGMGQVALPTVDLVTQFTSDFYNPYGGLTWGHDGFFYGTTYRSSNGNGSIFKMSRDGNLTKLHEFTGTDGISPVGTLARDSQGNFYGTTQAGGEHGAGSIYKLDSEGVLTTLVSFTGLTGEFPGMYPVGSLFLDTDGNLYGTTSSHNTGLKGSIFKYALEDGTFTTLVDLEDTAAASPYGALVRDDQGSFYGMTAGGGSSGYGTVYKLSPEGDFSVLVNFTGIAGANKGTAPRGHLTLGPDGSYYGMTFTGGSTNNGTVFKMTAQGVLTTLIEFTGTTGQNPGSAPFGSLTLGPDGNFYGMTSAGGTNNKGTVFQMTPEGLLTNLIHFTGSGSGPDSGSTPAYTQFAVDPRGNLYGTTSMNGTTSGTVIRINFAELGPIIQVSGLGHTLTNGQTATSSTDDTDVGLVAVGVNATRSATFVLTNTGETDLTFGNDAISVTGADFAPGNPPSTMVAPGSYTTITVGFTPSTPGEQTSTVTINSNDPDTPAFTFPLKGTGVTKPTVVTSTVTNITENSATLTGTVNPNGLGTSFSFTYSTHPNVTNNLNTTANQNLAAGFSNASASANISSLLPGTTYYYYIYASSQLGWVQSSIGSFTTAVPAPDPNVIMNTGMEVDAEGRAVYRPLPGVINNAGKVLFQAVGEVGSGTAPNLVAGSNDEWLMSDASGSPLVLLREGDQLGSNSGHYFSALFNHLLLGDSGQSFTSEKIAGATTDKDYAYLAVPSAGTSVDIISQEGDTAPDTGIFINSVGKPALDSQERLYFQGSLSGVATTLATGVWYDAGEGVTTLVQAGQNISTATGDAAWLGKVSNMLAAGGNGASFIAALQPNPANTKEKTDTLRNQAILSANVEDEGIEISVIARKGDSISGGSTLNTINGLARGVNEGHAFTALMKTGSNGVTTANDEILATVVEGETVIIAREATTQLVAGFAPKSFGDFYVTASGDVIFQAVLKDALATNDGILCKWVAATEEIEVLAREGDTAPGTGGLNYGTLHTVGVSDNGNIVLQTILSDGKHALHRNMGEGFEFLVRAGTGQTVDFNGSARNILSIGLYNKTTGTGGGGGGMGSVINDSGDVFAVLSVGTGDYVARIYRVETPPPPPEPIP